MGWDGLEIKKERGDENLGLEGVGWIEEPAPVRLRVKLNLGNPLSFAWPFILIS